MYLMFLFNVMICFVMLLFREFAIVELTFLVPRNISHD